MDAVANKNMEQFARRLLDMAATNGENAPVSTKEAVAEIVKGIRWEPRPDRNPPTIVVMRRGSKKKGVSNVVATIAPNGAFADLYPSWQPVLADWQRKRSANGGSRVTHEDLGFGGVPVAESQKE